jgi:citrate lyase subunit beta/citryl-CoA lyase
MLVGVPIQHDGKLHDRASFRYYWMILQNAQKSNLQAQTEMKNLGW